jgi:hypothetical protein
MAYAIENLFIFRPLLLFETVPAVLSRPVHGNFDPAASFWQEKSRTDLVLANVTALFAKAGRALRCNVAGRSRSGSTGAHCGCREPGAALQHDPEKCVAVFRKDHAQTIS